MKWEISSPSGIIVCDYLNIIDSDAIGGATFYAGHNSIDSGNNTGWIFDSPEPPASPDRYWVGGTGDWSDSTNHWATESGGTPGATPPTSNGNVIIDANSGLDGGTIILDIPGICNDFTSNSGFDYNIIGLEIVIEGSLQFENGLTINSDIYLDSTSIETIVLSGATINADVNIIGTGDFVLQDNLDIAGNFIINNGNFDANNNNVTAESFTFDSTSNNTVIILGSGVWEVTNGNWDVIEDSGIVAFIGGESTIKFINTESVIFDGGGKIYDDIWITNDEVIIQDSNTFSDFKVDAGVSVEFTDETTQIVASLTINGSEENLITLGGTGELGWTISCPSGIISCTYLDISYSTATGGATFIADKNSIDGGNNIGWEFYVEPSKSAYPTTEEQLDTLKIYILSNLKTNQKIVNTVKAGLIDIRDELPFVMVIPQIEMIYSQYNNNLYIVERTFKMDIVNNAYHIEDVRESLKVRLRALKALFSIADLRWQLRDSNGNIQIFDYVTSTEIYSEPVNYDNKYTQFCEILVKLKSYYQATNISLPTEVKEIHPIELLDYLMAQIKIDIPVFEEYWRDVSKPISLNNFPAMGVFFAEADADKNSQTSTDFNHIPVILRIYSSLATKEIAFRNHLKNVERVKQWILQRPLLDGSVSNFSLTSIDYGIDTFARPFQGKTEDVPVFRSDITIDCSLIQFN